MCLQEALCPSQRSTTCFIFVEANATIESNLVESLHLEEPRGIVKTEYVQIRTVLSKGTRHFRQWGDKGDQHLVLLWKVLTDGKSAKDGQNKDWMTLHCSSIDTSLSQTSIIPFTWRLALSDKSKITQQVSDTVGNNTHISGSQSQTSNEKLKLASCHLENGGKFGEGDISRPMR
ncbi:unnamed protein product [Caretta caretta]